MKERLRKQMGVVTMAGRLRNLRAAGFAPRQIIDAGAFIGEWTAMASEIFPDAHFLLIEPQPQLTQALAAFCGQLGRAVHRSVLLGRSPGEARFLIQGSNSRIVGDSENCPPSQVISIPVSRLADVAAEHDFSACEFLKLDLQGHELEALAGAGDLFGHVEVILIEASWLPIGPCPLAAEVIAMVTGRGYVLYDVMGFNYRPLDGALWQTDFLFVRGDSPLLARRHDWA